MPGPAIHHIIAQIYLKDVLKADTTRTTFWNEMETGTKGPFFNLGGQGPDILFFNTSDWPEGCNQLAKAYVDVQALKEEFVDRLTGLIPPELWQAIDGCADRSVVLNQIRDVKARIGALSAWLGAKLEQYVTDSLDVFSLLDHPQQDGQLFKKWWWFDTLHIRRSGKFLKELMTQSADNSAERAYALGYLTHYAGDTVGHSFVNAISGGPYRTHVKRHKVVENYQDVWAYGHYFGEELSSSGLGSAYLVDGNSQKLPNDFKQFLLKCIKNVYYKNGAPSYGKNIRAADLDIAYRNWLDWFMRATTPLILPTPQPYSLTVEIVQAWEQFKSTVGGIGAYVGDSFSGGGGIWGFFKAAAAAIAGSVLLSIALIDFVVGQFTTLGAAPIRFFLSLCYETLYKSYQMLQRGLAMNGFTFPLRADLNDYLIGHMINTKAEDFYHRNAMSLPSANAYPSRGFKIAGTAESHLIYPFPVEARTHAEFDNCRGFPDSYYSVDPSHYISDPSLAFSASQYTYYRNFVESGAEGITEAGVNGKFLEHANAARTGGLGNAVTFGAALYKEFLASGAQTQYADFCLDSDRGYAFKCWRKVKDLSQINSTADINVAVDPDGNVKNKQTDIISGSIR